jgi:hypothetical protein
MASEPQPIDISTIPELERLAREVAEDGQPRLLRADGTDLAILSPVRRAPRKNRASDLPADGEDDDLLRELERRRKLGMSVADMTAGIFKKYAKTPPPTPREEKEAFEQAVAEQVMESMRDG